MKKALLISGGREVSRGLIGKYSDRFIIIADGGAKILRRYGLKADLLLGDLDSIDEDSLNYIKKNNIKISKFPAKKDLTDTHLCIEYLLKNKYDDIVIIGALGTRLDHELANVSILKKLYRLNIKAKIEDNNNEVYYVEEGNYSFKKGNKKYISVINLCEETIYSTKGLEYEVSDLIVNYKNPGLGVSNEIVKDVGEIEIKKGEAFIILSRD